MSVRTNWEAFQDSLARAAQRYGRRPGDIGVMAVSKTRSVEEIREAREAGLECFGENRVEEAAEKFARLDPCDYPLCLVGHLQSGKAARIDRRFSGVHSVDSVKIARKLSALREATGDPLSVLIQVNTSGENTKFGFRDRSILADAAAEIAGLPGMALQGLMTMAPFVSDEARVRSCFAACREWAGDIEHLVAGNLVVSMGMSSDYGWAIAEGSTMLRIGTILFGERE